LISPILIALLCCVGRLVQAKLADKPDELMSKELRRKLEKTRTL
jgi:hypothetical protein